MKIFFGGRRHTIPLVAATMHLLELTHKANPIIHYILTTISKQQQRNKLATVNIVDREAVEH